MKRIMMLAFAKYKTKYDASSFAQQRQICCTLCAKCTVALGTHVRIVICFVFCKIRNKACIIICFILCKSEVVYHPELCLCSLVCSGFGDDSRGTASENNQQTYKVCHNLLHIQTRETSLPSQNMKQIMAQTFFLQILITMHTCGKKKSVCRASLILQSMEQVMNHDCFSASSAKSALLSGALLHML